MNNNQVKLRQKDRVETERTIWTKALGQQIRETGRENGGSLYAVWKQGKKFLEFYFKSVRGTLKVLKEGVHIGILKCVVSGDTIGNGPLFRMLL